MRVPWSAVLVHVFTALGVVCALLATRAALVGAWEEVFLWLGVALAIDGVDGTFARLVRVSSRLRRFSGDRLDLVIDYITYVFVPALALLQAGYLSGGFGLVLASLILMSSLFHFADLESKTDDHCFVGFPAIWNVVAFYIFAFQLSAGASAVVVLACVALTFVPLRWGHPMRTPFFKPLTLTLSALWMIAAGTTLWSGFPAGFYAKAVLAVVAVYGVGITLARGLVRREG
ncbi:MAG: phosphatidylcholine/phosphatidylserine synthase [Hyphomicrobiaceae bacterium]